MISKYSAVLFDFDGTLIDSSKGIFKSVLYALESFGIKETDMTRLNYFIGPPLWDSFMHQYSVDSVTADKMVEKFREDYHTSGVHISEMYDGIPEILKLLKSNGIKVGIASSKPFDFIKMILKQYDIADYFDDLVGVDFNNKQADKKFIIQNAVSALGLNMDDGILMVGDRHFDITGACENTIDSVGVLYGFGTRQELEKAGATYIIEHICELEKIVFDKN
ncbi:MAG: HAD hydrolase-like protein [Clostridiales bacterium]|nr:HAD hydrolase-like protein [Clostridiales bacterium]